MFIRGIGATFPSVSVSNNDVLELVRKHSEAVFAGDIDQLLGRIQYLLDVSGGEYRTWTNPKNPADRPINLIKRSIQIALDDAEITKDEVDLLIYCGVGKGCLEPGQSYLVAQAMKMDRTECFDVLDACMSWARALQMAYHFLKAGTYRTIAIVNGEINDYHNGPLFPHNFKVRNMAELQWLFPSFTIGSASTCTILSGERPETFDEWTWKFESQTNMADYCVIGGHDIRQFAEPSDRLTKRPPFVFSAFGKEQHDASRLVYMRWVAEGSIDFDGVKYIYPHAASKKAWDEWHFFLPQETSFYHIYPRTGNVVSASVPAGIYLSKTEGKIQRGDRLAGLMVSAGMSFSTFKFTY